MAEAGILSTAFRLPGPVTRSHYRFRVELERGGWCCYAWPDDNHARDEPSFYIDQDEVLRSTTGYGGFRWPCAGPGWPANDS